MAEYIDKNELIKILKEDEPLDWNDTLAQHFQWQNDVRTIRDMPSISITHCKNCKHCVEWYGDKGRCFLWHESGIDVWLDGFCNYGRERNI